jgi:hypothetical protein
MLVTPSFRFRQSEVGKTAGLGLPIIMPDRTYMSRNAGSGARLPMQRLPMQGLPVQSLRRSVQEGFGGAALLLIYLSLAVKSGPRLKD